GCCSVSDVDDARRVADHLGIAHHVFNFGDDFTRDVIDPYVAAHQAGQTPNPCIECNRHLKFDRLLRRADALGFDHVATGHHVRIGNDASGRPHLQRGHDLAKDQSYVLYVVPGSVLPRVSFPIGHVTKDEVRAEAARLGLRTASKPDSQDVCFITSTQGRSGFLDDRVELHPGEIVDASDPAGKPIGSVDAVELVTIGQRRGLGLGGYDTPRYVVDVDVSEARVTIGEKAALLSSTVELDQVVWAHDPIDGPVLVQSSAHGDPLPGRVSSAPDGVVSVTFDKPRRRIAPGQSVVFYRDDLVVGGGVSVRSENA
ncbi:MAG: tRNA 2-thiouridine(34) synthase MnmA, partial [Acidimicrobiales bacterium]|nr:tRNA 2-thiouridine(34) synthase MnmA [Acidimicrobiales bacterium]